jgi:hypothetical protein
MGQDPSRTGGLIGRQWYVNWGKPHAWEIRKGLATQPQVAQGCATGDNNPRKQWQVLDRLDCSGRDVRKREFCNEESLGQRSIRRPALKKDVGFTFVALVALTLDMGANTAIFSVVYGALLAALPYPNADQLVMVWSKINGHSNAVSAGDYLEWSARLRYSKTLLRGAEILSVFPRQIVRSQCTREYWT